MSERPEVSTPNTSHLDPLPGEAGIPNVAAPQRLTVSPKGLLAVALLVGSLIAVSAFSIQRFASSRKTEDTGSKLVRDKPSAASTEPRKLEMPNPVAASSVAQSAPRIPAILPTDEEAAEPIGVRRTGGQAPAGSSQRPLLPEDAPVLIVSSRPNSLPRNSDAPNTDPPNPDDPLAATSRNLQGYQRQLQGLLDNLTQSAAHANGLNPPATANGPLLNSAPPSATAPQAPGLFGGQLQGSATPRVAAGLLGNRSLTLPKGTAFTCALKTKVISATSGLVGCQVQRNVFSDDGRVLLIERGSHLDGEYRIASLRPGTVRIPVLWTRIRTPQSVVVDIESPGTGPLGESGIDGYVDNRWRERIGAAMLLSLIDDSVKLVIQNQTESRQGDTLVLPATTANTSKLAEKVLDSTINIPPLIYQNQGGLVGIYVARDVDFSAVYALRPTPIPVESAQAPASEGVR
jgi:type IV secretion system protein VirB10